MMLYKLVGSGLTPSTKSKTHPFLPSSSTSFDPPIGVEDEYTLSLAKKYSKNYITFPAWVDYSTYKIQKADLGK